MQPQTDDRLMAEYKDPYLYTDKATLATLRKERIEEIGTRTIIIFIVLICIAVMGSDNYYPRTRSDIAIAGIVLGLPVYVIYGLFTIKRTVIGMRQQQLMTAHAALRVHESLPRAPSMLATHLIKVLWVILLMVVIMVFMAMWWTNR